MGASVTLPLTGSSPDTSREDAGRPRARVSAQQNHQRQMIWDWVQTRPRFTVAEVAQATGLSRKVVDGYLKRLLTAGFVQPAPPAAGLAVSAQAPACAAAPALRADGSLSQDEAATTNMWRAMRLLQVFTPRDLAAHCTTPQVIVTIKAARDYCGLLLEHRYLRVLKKATATSPATYRLIASTGPVAPAARYVRRLWDGNTGELIAAGGRVEQGQ